MDHLSRIGIFIAVTKAESFAGAARELGITSSAVSKQIQNLEQDLRTKLLNRTTRNVSLTEEGAVLFERASRALEDIREATEQINELKTTPRGVLKISAPMTLGVKYLKKPIAAFAKAYPDVILDIQFDDRIIDIAEEGFDVVLRLGILKDSSMIARKLAPCPIHVCASPGYLKQYGTPQTADELGQHNVLAYTRNRGAHEWRYKGPEGREGVVALQSTFKCDAAEMMIEGACNGLGVIIMPELFIRDELRTQKLIPFLTQYTHWPERGLYAIFPPNRYLSTRLRLFIDHIDAYCRQTFS